MSRAYSGIDAALVEKIRLALLQGGCDGLTDEAALAIAILLRGLNSSSVVAAGIVELAARLGIR